MFCRVQTTGSAPALDGGVLGGQAEGVPADRVEHVEATLHPVAGDDVTERVGLRVAHVQVAGGVREHVEDVLAGPLLTGPTAGEGLGGVPDRQPAGLERVRVPAGRLGLLGLAPVGPVGLARHCVLLLLVGACRARPLTVPASRPCRGL
jgi:hypothetical protein